MPATFPAPGDTHTAADYILLPRGVVAYATSTATYNVTASTVISTGMTATWTAQANRRYKITYYEPQVITPTDAVDYVVATIRVTNAAGAAQTVVYAQNDTTTTANGRRGIVAIAVITPAAGSQTYVGCAIASSTSGTPQLIRAADSPSFILVEDVGAA